MFLAFFEQHREITLTTFLMSPSGTEMTLQLPSYYMLHELKLHCYPVAFVFGATSAYLAPNRGELGEPKVLNYTFAGRL